MRQSSSTVVSLTCRITHSRTEAQACLVWDYFYQIQGEVLTDAVNVSLVRETTRGLTEQGCCWTPPPRPPCENGVDTCNLLSPKRTKRKPEELKFSGCEF